jgi:hypothetical protein
MVCGVRCVMVVVAVVVVVHDKEPPPFQSLHEEIPNIVSYTCAHLPA